MEEVYFIICDTPYYGGKVAETLFNKGLCLPSGFNMTDEERARVTKVIVGMKNKRWLRKY